MINVNSKNTYFDSSELIIILYQKKLVIFIIFLIAIISAIIFSSPTFITPLFKSTTIIYPTTSSSISNTLIVKNQNSDLLRFGNEEESEQLLQLLNSTLIRDLIIEKFNLIDHYEMNVNSPLIMTHLFKEFDNKFKFTRTEFMALEITVLDHDSQMAANMANEIVRLLDTVKINMQRKRAMDGLKIVENEYLQLKAEIKVMEDSLNILRGKGIHDYESQAEMINQQLAIEIAAGNTSAVKRLEAQLKVLAEYGGPYVSLRDALAYEKGNESRMKSKYNEAKIDAMNSLPQSFIVSEAFAAERKSYPSRVIIVLLTAIAVLFFTVFIILFLEKLSKIKLRKV